VTPEQIAALRTQALAGLDTADIQSLTPDQIAAYEAELAALRDQVATLEAEKAVLKKRMPFHLERLLGKRPSSSRR
jgi:cell division protein FtsB